MPTLMVADGLAPPPSFDAADMNPIHDASRRRPEPGELAIIVFAALLVVAFGPFFWETRWTPRALLYVMVLPFGCWELVRLIRQRDRAAVLAGTLLVWALIVGLTASAWRMSILPSFNRQEGVWTLGAALGCWALGRRLSPIARQWLGYTFVAACGLSGLVGILQTALKIDTGPLEMLGDRATGFSENPVYFGATMAGAVGWLAWSYAHAVRGRLRLVLLAGVAVGSFLISLSGSRAAFATQLFVVGLAVLKFRRAHMALLPLGLVIGTVGGTLFERSVADSHGSVTDRLSASGSGLDTRLTMWRYGLDAFLDRPLIGHGLGRFRPAVQQYFEPSFVRTNVQDDLVQGWFDSHNIVLQIAVGLGIVGLLLTLAFVVVAGRRSSGPLAFATIGIAVTWLLQPSGLPTFALAALLFGASQPALAMTRDAAVGIARRARVGLGVAALASVLLGAWIVVADARMDAATSSLGSEAAASAAANWFPHDAAVANEAATNLFTPTADAGVQRQVLEWNRRATELEPDFPYWWVRLGIRQMVYGDLVGARESLDEAIRLQPYHPVALQMLQILSERTGDDALREFVDQRLAEIAVVDAPTPDAAGA